MQQILQAKVFGFDKKDAKSRPAGKVDRHTRQGRKFHHYKAYETSRTRSQKNAAMKICPQCNQQFEPGKKNPKQTYCGQYCQGKAYRAAHNHEVHDFRFHPVLIGWLHK
jgi:hypothetical protein